MVLVNQATTMGTSTSAHNLDAVNTIGILQNENVYEIYLDVSVMNPITRKASDGKLVTTYAIYIETNDSAFTMSRSMVRRRYSDFVVLRSILREQHPSLTVPRLPTRTLLGKRFDQHFIQERCSGLQDFLKAVVEQPIYLSNKSLHLFLQTSLSMEQVQNVVNGGESFELPHNNSPSLLLYPVDTKVPNAGDRVGILKREISSSLATCAEHECQVRAKHEHMRVGSGILVCPYAIIPGKGGPANIRHMAGSAPFWVPGGSPKPTSVCMRSCASDTCLDGTAAGGGSLNGSKKRVSFFIDKEDKQSLLRRVEAAHKDSNGNKQKQEEEQQQQPKDNDKATVTSASSSAQAIPSTRSDGNDEVDGCSNLLNDEQEEANKQEEVATLSNSSNSSSVVSDSNINFEGLDEIEVITGIDVTSKISSFTNLVSETVTAEEVVGC